VVTIMARNSIALLLAAIVLSACSGLQPKAELALPAGPVWPDSGEPVRIRFIASVTQPEDLAITQGVWSRFWDLLVGAAQRRLVNPMGIDVDESGTLYVVDAASRNVKVFDRRQQAYRMEPDDDTALVAPIKPLADGGTKRLYVSDAGAGLVRILPLSSGGAPGELGKGLFERPTGLALNRQNDELLVLDTRQGAVFRFDRVSLTAKGRFGEPGSGPGQLNRPTDLAVNSAGEILICDALNFRVQVFSADGRFVRAFGSPGDSPGTFSRPRSLAVDSDDNIYVLDSLFDNVQLFDSQGRLLLDFGGHGRERGRFWMPSALHIDRNDRIYVADTYNQRLQLFQYLRQAVQP
jgi:DNA-binding beta-propeller fold protein YncE